MGRNRKILWLMSVLLLLTDKTYCQQRVYSIEDMLQMYRQTDNYSTFVSDSIVYENNMRLFKIQVLPTASLSATLPNISNSISAVTQPDGSDKFVNRFNATSNISLNVSQLVPFTGGTLSLSSSLVRMDNFNPSRSKSFNLNLFNLSYSQNLSGVNQYKWQKQEMKETDKVQKVKFIQQKEAICRQIVSLFFDLYIAQEEYRILQESCSLTEYVFDVSSKQFLAGTLAEEDYIQAEIEMTKAKNNLSTANIEKSTKTLCAFFNMPNQELALSFDYYNVPDICERCDEETLCKRCLLFSAEMAKNVTDIQNTFQLKKLKSAYFPSLSLSAGGGLNTSSDEFKTLIWPYNKQLSVVVSISFPLLNWGKSKLQYRNKVEEINKSELSYKAQIEKLRIGCHYDLSRMAVLREEIRGEIRLLELYKRRLELMKIKLEQGKIDVSEIIRTNRAILQAELNAINRIHSYYDIIFLYRQQALIDLRTGELLY